MFIYPFFYQACSSGLIYGTKSLQEFNFADWPLLGELILKNLQRALKQVHPVFSWLVYLQNDPSKHPKREEGRRRRGRPKETWRRTAEREF